MADFAKVEEMSVEKPLRWSEKTPVHAFGVGRAGRDRTDDHCTVLTPDKRQLIVELIKDGSSHVNAAKMAGILPTTLQVALVRGKKDILHSENTDLLPTILGTFYLDVSRAEASFQIGLEAKFSTAMEKEPKAATAYLELLGRLHPNELGRRQVVKVEQDTILRIAFVEKDGEEWQRGQTRASIGEHAQKAIAASIPEGNEIIDAELRESESEDDNVF